jgi:D-glycero-alpha-D-manno-heptose-7-phosphate kinase
MIIVRAPLRISLGGGGTDLPDWYREHSGFLVSATINKYIYFTGCERPFDRKYWLSYSKVEVCDQPVQVQHDLLRSCLKQYHLPNGVEIHSISELPGSSGLGSSGAFLVGTLSLLNSLTRKDMTRTELAEKACHIEMVELGRASGKQDQYISAFGGISSMTLDRSGNVKITNLDLSPQSVRRLESNLLIYYTGVSRDANEILSEQSRGFSEKSSVNVASMKEIQDIGFQSRDAILSGDFDRLGKLMDDHWVAKKKTATKMSSGPLDVTYAKAIEHGASGGKIMGAGGGGYWMFYVQPERQLSFRQKMKEMGLVEMLWSFDQVGCAQVYSK